jgi:hypothetical protein
VKNFFGYLGRSFITFLQTLSSLYYLFRETLVQSVVLLTDRKKRRQARILVQVDEIGTRSLPLVLMSRRHRLHRPHIVPVERRRRL